MKIYQYSKRLTKFVSIIRYEINLWFIGFEFKALVILPSFCWKLLQTLLVLEDYHSREIAILNQCERFYLYFCLYYLYTFIFLHNKYRIPIKFYFDHSIFEKYSAFVFVYVLFYLKIILKIILIIGTKLTIKFLFFANYQIEEL